MRKPRRDLCAWRMRCRDARILFIVVLTVLLASCRNAPKEEPVEAGALPFMLRPSKMLAETPELRVRGREIYEKKCAACHGFDGKGEGEAAYLLYPKPRDFVRAYYRMVSTWEGFPTDEDLYFTISRGIPGSAMPAWAHLSEEDRWALVYYVKSFAEDAFTAERAQAGSRIILI